VSGVGTRRSSFVDEQAAMVRTVIAQITGTAYRFSRFIGGRSIQEIN
jgi:hypothetical protein